MFSKILLSILLISAPLGFFKACSSVQLSKADIIVASLDAASTLPEAQGTCLQSLFQTAHDATLAYKNNPTSAEWSAVSAAISSIKVAACSNNSKLADAVAAIVKVFNDLQPAARVGSRAAPPTLADFERVPEADLKQLQKATKH